MIIEQHSWSPSRGWGYRREPNSKTLANSYSRLIKQIGNLHENQGLSAAVLTQTTDVETECNGLLSYDRAIAKLEMAELAQINSSIHRPSLDHVILADAMLGAATWKYTFQSPTTNWFTPEFEASGWREGPAGFGTTETPGALVKTEWKTSDIWLRRQFELSKGDLSNVKLDVHHDEDAEIYLNGVLAAKLAGFTTYYEHFDLLPDATATLKTGVNTLAVHCHQTSGGQYIDVGLVVPANKEPPAESPR